MNFNSIDLDGLLVEFQPLIYKTLQRLNIGQNHRDYEDFFQELQIHLLNLFNKFKYSEEDGEANRFKFTAYAGQGLYWHGINLFRNKGFNAYESMEDDYLDLASEAEIHNGLPDSLLVEDFLRQAKLRLSDQDYELLLYMVEGSRNADELAHLMGVSRDTIYQRKKRIKGRLQGIKECLMD